MTMQLWGGPECTVNRSGDSYVDQSRLSGHDGRLTDLDLFAGLGLTAIRYPVLWERVAPDDPDRPDWRWSDERLGRLRDLGIRPIAGLVHHGSGPRHTHLLDDGFAAKLGHYAGQVAERYPWIEEWTPINEPLTTARFSALYGHWYPHAADEPSFWRALVNQVDGTRAAMRAVRRVNPAARLIQTDDLGRSYATSRLAEQAAFDNMRRWAGWDLLFGRVTRHHPLWHRFNEVGLGDRLRRIADDPCPPDMLGVNHYLTSDRFLDHRLQLYPAHVHGGNGRITYADVEAVRVLDPPPPGLAGALREAWQRYRVPIAITELHNGCTREEQLRWVAEGWDTAVALRGEGVDIRAVTAWSLLGSHGWNTLLTAPGAYEPGVFDAATGTPRPTALATLWRGLPQGAPRHPVAAEPGWWRRPERLIYRPLIRPAGPPQAGTPLSPVLLIHGSGRLAQGFTDACVARGIRHLVAGRVDDIAATLDRWQPWAVVHAGCGGGDDPEAADIPRHRAGADAWAQACAERAIGSLRFSSDSLVDGRAPVEPGALVIVTAGFPGEPGADRFAAAVVEALVQRRRFAAAGDQVVRPAFVPALAEAALDLLIDGEGGLWHLAGDEAVSWADLAERIAAGCGLDVGLVDFVPAASLGWGAPHPDRTAPSRESGLAIGSLAAGIARFAHDLHREVARSDAA